MESCAKQAHEFGLQASGMTIAPLLGFITEIHALGLDVAQGMLLAQPFYWDLNDRTRAFTKRFLPKTPNNYPSSLHAACYSAVTHYLKTAAAAGVPVMKESGRAAIAAMKRLPTDDDCFGPASIRPNGRFAPPVMQFQVKTQAESTMPWDVFKLVDTVPAELAWRPADGSCPLDRR